MKLWKKVEKNVEEIFNLLCKIASLENSIKKASVLPHDENVVFYFDLLNTFKDTKERLRVCKTFLQVLKINALYRKQGIISENVNMSHGCSLSRRKHFIV